jgi:transmembrane sensor
LIPADRLYELIALKLSGEASGDEIRELQALLQQNADDQYLFEIMDKYWSQHAELADKEPEDEEKIFQRIISVSGSADEIPATVTEEIPVRKSYRLKWFSYAAAFIILCGTVVFFLLNSKSHSATGPTSQVSEVAAEPGSRSKLILPDGTKVWLNAESKITYLSTFNNELREVNLTGEAYFDVVHDPSRPFIVHTSEIDIKVLGTAFTVKSYPSDKTIETTLLRGSIEVLKHDDPGAPRVILRPREKLVFNKSSADTQVSADLKPTVVTRPEINTGLSITLMPKYKHDSLQQETAWVYNKLLFEGDRFDELAVKLERWFGIHITFRDEKLKQYRFKGVFENETVEEAMEALQLTAKFKYTYDGKEIHIYDKQ